MPRRLRLSNRFNSVLRFALVGLVLPCFYWGGAGAAFFYRQHAVNAARDPYRLQPAIAPNPATRLLVFAPHCDDETLGCAGLIQQTLATGGTVQTVMLTNGDGFRTAVERQVRNLRIEPSDYIQFATLRQQESYRALEHLGLKQSDVTFLGYPDRGLTALWNSHWNPANLYTSTYTRHSSSPYTNTFHPNVGYCGANVVADIKSILRRYHPTLVTVTHPAEDHVDHGATSAFVSLALKELQADPNEAVWVNQTQLKYYLVHRGDWPMPQGMHPTSPLLPPTEMTYADTRWTMLPLTPEQTTRKGESIELYPSQTAVMRRYLLSFVRRNELLGEIPARKLAHVSEGVMHVDANSKDWESLPPVLVDPVRDNVLRDLQGSGDIQTLYSCRDRRNLYLRLDTRQPISRRMTYTIHLRAFNALGETTPTTLNLRLSAAQAEQQGIKIVSQDKILEAAIPWAQITQGLKGKNVSTLAISADTSLAGVEVDKTGVRLLDVESRGK